jgi:type I restriction enzyme S subunit
VKVGWTTKRLEEVCQIERGGSPRPIQNFITTDSNGLNWIKIGDATASGKYIYKTEEKIRPEGAKRSRMVYEGDFILSNSMSFGRPYIMKTSGCIHDGWLVLREREPKINQDYLYYVLGSDLVFHQFDRLAAGSTVRNLNIGLVKGVEIPIPSASEQRRIVGILDEAFEGIATAKANAEKNLQNARALFKGHLQSVFTRPGLGWLEKTLEEAVDSKCSLSYGIVQPGEDKPGGLPIVRPTDLRARTIEMEGLKRIDPSLAESYRRTTLRGGDLLLCVRGSTGVVSVAAEELAGGNVTRGIVPIHFDDQFVAQDFGYYLMCSTPVQKQIREKTYGAALMQINICDLRNLILPIPPRPIQEALANRFESLLAETDRLASIYQQKLAALDELKKSLLHQAFSGEL